KIVVFPSVVPETFGRIAAEAMAAGKPVIGTQSGGILELVKHKETGLLVNPKSAKEIADAAIYLLKNEKLLKSMGEKGKKLIEDKYAPSIITRIHLNLYEEVISNCS
ncbi:MAG: glycosyltransferase family 4 protein, partial [Candidatus Subteraquimicrobiales bacterium]|nr:glycosyltransferase family 4 protein [Candidatus Subteraquimicrobiales bacterium]